MELSKCLEILSKRQADSSSLSSPPCPCALDPNRPKVDFCQVCKTDQLKVTFPTENPERDLSLFDCIELIIQVQQKRIKVLPSEIVFPLKIHEFTFPST